MIVHTRLMERYIYTTKIRRCRCVYSDCIGSYWICVSGKYFKNEIMDVLKLAIEWAKAEVLSTRFFIFFAIGFFIASVGFWQLGKTDLAKAYIIPTLVAGLLLMTIGIGLFYTNKSRIIQFEKAFNSDTSAFFQSEIERSESTLKEYTVVFKVIPILIFFI